MSAEGLLSTGLCEWERTPDPCSVTIFGASGDLTFRKLIPALYNLSIGGEISRQHFILGSGRSEMSDDAFRDKMQTAVLQAGLDPAHWDGFAQRLYYQPVAYNTPESYRALGLRLADLEAKHHTRGNRIFNMALPPSVYAPVAHGLHQAGLVVENGPDGPWRRLVVEKPFGYDLHSARELNESIGEGFQEHQVFRIDHYMTKQTVQNILILRFANAIFEPLWNRNYIDHVRINASESLGLEHRAGYYERSGILRDMFQNHMMELLALVAAEPPSLFAADRVRDKKAELFRCLRPLDLTNLHDQLVLGQYGPGEVDGKPEPGYRDDPGVHPESLTPTYALMRVFVDNWRWQGVPFYLTSGKSLKRKLTRIDIQFKPVPHSMFRQTLGENINANRLVIGIHPRETIFLNFQAMRPSTRLCLRTAGLHFSFYEGQEAHKLDAYAKALRDTMTGDQTLFWREDGLELCWAFIDPILTGCEACDDRALQLQPYAAGSLGPQKALEMLPAGSWPEKP